MTDKTHKKRDVKVSSIYGYKSRRPIVSLQFDNNDIHLEAADAESIGKELIAAAHASITDAFLIEWMMTTLNVPINGAASVLNDFRKWRMSHPLATTTEPWTPLGDNEDAHS